MSVKKTTKKKAQPIDFAKLPAEALIDTARADSKLAVRMSQLRTQLDQIGINFVEASEQAKAAALPTLEDAATFIQKLIE